MMDVGQPQREIIVEPIELPEPLREQPDYTPAEQPQEEPVNV